jgi:hypothetical protein
VAKKHHVKTHHWYDGILKTVEHTFESIEEAMGFVKISDASQVKVYNEEHELVHAENTTPKSTEPRPYA